MYVPKTYRATFVLAAILYLTLLWVALFFTLKTCNLLIKAKREQLHEVTIQRHLSTLQQALKRYEKAPSKLLQEQIEQEIKDLEELEGVNKVGLQKEPRGFTESEIQKGITRLLSKNDNPQIEILGKAFPQVVQDEKNREQLLLEINRLTHKQLFLPGDSPGNVLDQIFSILKDRLQVLETIRKWVVASSLFATAILLLSLALRLLTCHFPIFAQQLQMAGKGKFTPQLKERDDFEMAGKLINHLLQPIEKRVNRLSSFHKKAEQSQSHLQATLKEDESLLNTQEEALNRLETIFQQASTKGKRLAEGVTESSLSSSSEQADNAVTTLQNRMDALTEHSSQTVNLIKEIEEKVSGMNQLIDFIRKVSERANLLSLNAAIETATVTKEHESFASITQKIQRFSANTSSSTEQIGSIFFQMSSGVNKVKSEGVICLHEIHTGCEQLFPINNQLKRIAERQLQHQQQYQYFTQLLQNQATQAEESFTSLEKMKTEFFEKRETIVQLQNCLDQFGRSLLELRRLLKQWGKK